jgi:hypothetical protein
VCDAACPLICARRRQGLAGAPAPSLTRSRTEAYFCRCSVITRKPENYTVPSTIKQSRPTPSKMVGDYEDRGGNCDRVQGYQDQPQTLPLQTYQAESPHVSECPNGEKSTDLVTQYHSVDPCSRQAHDPKPCACGTGFLNTCRAIGM